MGQPPSAEQFGRLTQFSPNDKLPKTLEILGGWGRRRLAACRSDALDGWRPVTNGTATGDLIAGDLTVAPARLVLALDDRHESRRLD